MGNLQANWLTFRRPSGAGLHRLTLGLRRHGPLHDTWRLANGTAIRIRAAGPDDAPRIQALVRGLSMRSRYQRFFYPVHELTPDMLARFTQADPRNAITLLAVVRSSDHENSSPGCDIVVGMAQYVADPYPQRGEFASVVADAWQRSGIATRLLRNLICVARAAGIERLEGDVLSENEPMLALMRSLHVEIDEHPDDTGLKRAWKQLAVPAWKCSPLAALASGTGMTAAA